MATIEEFQEIVTGLRSNSFMSLNGAAAGIVGGVSTGEQSMLQLQRAVTAFSAVYQVPGAADKLQAARKDITGKIMVAVTVGAMSEQRADTLLDMLAQLMKERK